MIADEYARVFQLEKNKEGFPSKKFILEIFAQYFSVKNNSFLPNKNSSIKTRD
jgi:hypothetical protein